VNNEAEDIAGTVTIETETKEVTEEVSFVVNDVFNSFDKLQNKIKKYEAKKAVQLWRRDLQMIEAASK